MKSATLVCAVTLVFCSAPRAGAQPPAAALKPLLKPLIKIVKDGARIVSGIARDEEGKPAKSVEAVVVPQSNRLGDAAGIETFLDRATTSDIAPDGAFNVVFTQPLVAGESVWVTARREGDAAEREVVVQTVGDGGRVRACFAGGAVFSNSGGDFSRQDLALSFTLDKTWWQVDGREKDARKPKGLKALSDVRFIAGARFDLGELVGKMKLLGS